LVSFGGKKEADKPERSEGQKLLDAQSNRNMAAASAVAPHDEWVYGKPLQALNISVLRDYLMNEFKCLQNALPFGFDFERIVDDFVFLCFFVGEYFSLMRNAPVVRDLLFSFFSLYGPFSTIICIQRERLFAPPSFTGYQGWSNRLLDRELQGDAALSWQLYHIPWRDC
jgi:Xrn1 helical domain